MEFSKFINTLNFFIPDKIYLFFKDMIINLGIKESKKNGMPAPSTHRTKQLVIKHFQKNNEINILVETGTFRGDMVQAQLNNFQQIYSIELGETLWKKAVKRFKKYKHVKILLGDSGKVLAEILTNINEKILFWLDGHYSAGITARGEKDCPIYEELNVILNSNMEHVILIDDARCFNGSGDYPSLQELSKLMLLKRPQSSIKVEDDIIRVILK